MNNCSVVCVGRVLLRVRLLYYLKQEVIGAQEEKVFLGKHYSEIDLPTPTHDGEVPVAWWDEDADKSLLIGTHKHGQCPGLRREAWF